MRLQRPTIFEGSPDEADYNAILRRGPMLLAWEVLRRDPAYRSAYDAQKANILLGMAAEPDFLARWGMHFR